ncbi:MAG: response regulator transcription factor [Ruminococcus sp.]|nr:response regulator transcription factor [Ruminococcus sp.]MBQ8906566.1 response regulator transcription factor [Ruminococcus sp.]
MTYTILLVEDDAALAGGICFALENEGYHVLHADTIEKAETLWHDANLVLLDVTLPDGSGFSFCKKLRERESVPVILLTARSLEEDIIHGLELGADDYITKPFSLSILLARIKALLRRSLPAQDNIPEGLTALELKLLEYLRLNSGQVLTREQIFNHLWDYRGSFVDDNTLSVQIRRLREKIDTDGVKHIRTVRGVGYQWMD